MGKRKNRFGDLCKDCQQPITEDNCVHRYSTTRSDNYIQGRCRTCFDAHYKQHDCIQRRAKNWREWKYDLSHDEYLAKLALQDNKCEICETPFEEKSPKVHVDHDHETGKTRGILCMNCNLALGLIGDKKSTLFKMVYYLNKYEMEE